MKQALLFYIFFPCILFSQVGINKVNPVATLDISSQGTSSMTKSIEVNDENNVQIFAIYDNGNLEFKNALKPNGNAGQKGQYLFSQGANLPPIWKNILPENSKQLFDVFNIQQYNDNVNNYSAFNWHKVILNQIALPIDNSIGSWTNNEFTVLKKGIYYISVALKMYSGTNANSNQSRLRIRTTNLTHQVNSQTTQNSTATPIVFYQNANVEIASYLIPGDKVWFEGYSPASWFVDSAILHVKYAEVL